MFDPEKLKVLMTRYLCMVLGGLFSGCAALAVLATGIMLVGLFRGEWAVLHLFAMICMAGAFGMLAAIFFALLDRRPKYRRKHEPCQYRH